MSPHPERRGLSRRRLLGSSAAVAAGVAAGVAGPGVAGPSGGAQAYAEDAAATPNAPAGLTFHVVADTHVAAEHPVTMHDLRATLTDLQGAAPDPDALVVLGDLTEYARPRDYRLVDLALASGPHPGTVVLAMGEHEYADAEDPAVSRRRFLDFAGISTAYGVRRIDGPVPTNLVTLAPLDGALPARLGTEQLDWLEATLREVAAPDRATLCFLHPALEDLAPPDLDRLTALYRETPSLIGFWAHRQLDLNWHRVGPDPTLLGRPGGFWRAHTGATTYLNEQLRNPDGTIRAIVRADWRQGLVVDVTASGVRIRGRDTYASAWVRGFDATIPLG